MTRDEALAALPDDECLTCGERLPLNECPKSQRPCGHHCNCSWVHDHCHWCGRVWGEVDQPTIERLLTMNAPIESNHLSDENGNPAGGQTIGKGIQIDWQNGPLARAMRERGLKLWPGQVVLETAVNVAEPTPYLSDGELTHLRERWAEDNRAFRAPHDPENPGRGVEAAEGLLYATRGLLPALLARLDAAEAERDTWEMRAQEAEEVAGSLKGEGAGLSRANANLIVDNALRRLYRFYKMVENGGPDGSELDQSVAEDAAVAVRWLGPDFGEETP